MTQETLDVARYIIDVTAQLQAVAIKAHLDRLAYLLGMAKVEGEVFVFTSGDSDVERAEKEPYQSAVGLPHEKYSFD